MKHKYVWRLEITLPRELRIEHIGSCMLWVTFPVSHPSETAFFDMFGNGYDPDRGFSWARRTQYLSERAARRKAYQLERLGARVRVVRSLPLEFES